MTASGAGVGQRSAGLAVYDGDRIVIVVSFAVQQAMITRVDFVMASDKLPHRSDFQTTTTARQPVGVCIGYPPN